VVEDSGGNVHAVLGTYCYQGIVTEIMSGRTNFGKSSNVPAQDLLHWEAMLYHKRSGDRYFNLAGYSPNPANEKEAGIRRFKEKWGGREISVPSYTLIHEPRYVRAGRWLQTKIGSA
jgi:lipid II:glycine glycyltransferase (peptidoglycan interpeptide bridge formation enzyme)